MDLCNFIFLLRGFVSRDLPYLSRWTYQLEGRSCGLKMEVEMGNRLGTVCQMQMSKHTQKKNEEAQTKNVSCLIAETKYILQAAKL